eukprot:scaffold180519_cov18-Prasinocladus_malaysianus.AAC.1
MKPWPDVTIYGDVNLPRMQLCVLGVINGNTTATVMQMRKAQAAMFAGLYLRTCGLGGCPALLAFSWGDWSSSSSIIRSRDALAATVARISPRGRPPTILCVALGNKPCQCHDNVCQQHSPIAHPLKSFKERRGETAYSICMLS